MQLLKDKLLAVNIAAQEAQNAINKNDLTTARRWLRVIEHHSNASAVDIAAQGIVVKPVVIEAKARVVS